MVTFTIAHLPKLASGSTIRGFGIRKDILSRQTVTLRKGLDLSSGAKKLGVAEDILSPLISNGQIRIEALKAAVEAGSLIINLREGERSNTAEVVLARLGEEGEVLEFNILTALKNNPDMENRILLLMNYLRCITFADPADQRKFVVATAKSLYPDPTDQGKFVVAAAKSLYSDPADQKKFVVAAARDLYSDHPTNQGRFVVAAAVSLYSNSAEQEIFIIDAGKSLLSDDQTCQRRREFLIAIATASLYSDPADQGEFAGHVAWRFYSAPEHNHHYPEYRGNFLSEVALHLYPNLEDRGKFVVAAAKGYSNISATLGEYVGEIALRLYSDPADQGKFIVATALRLYSDPANQGEIRDYLFAVARLYSDPADRGKVVGQVALRLYSDPADHGKFVGEAAKNLYSDPKSQRGVVAAAVENLYSDSADEGTFVVAAVKNLYSDSADQGNFVAAVARILYPLDLEAGIDFMNNAAHQLGLEPENLVRLWIEII